MRNTRRLAVLLTAACLALSASAEVTQLPPGSTAGLPAGSTPPAVAVPAHPIAATSPTLSRPRPIDSTIKTSAAPQQEVVDKYIHDSVIRLMSDDATAIEQARADLIAAVSSPNPATPSSPVYLNGYIATLVQQLQPLVAKASLAKRLNIAIVIARVCQNVNQANNGAKLDPLVDFILGELNDKSDAVAVWGMKAVGELQSPNQGGNLPAKIQNAIVPSIESHALSGPLTEDAYQALNVSGTDFNIDTTMKIYSIRLGGYANGAVPPDPSVDRLAASHLTSTAMWAKMAPPKQAQAMELIRRNIEAASAVLISPTASPETLRDLRKLLWIDAAAVEVVTNSPTPSVGNLHLDAHQLRTAAEHDNTPVATLAEDAKKVVDGIPAAFPGAAAVAKP